MIIFAVWIICLISARFVGGIDKKGCHFNDAIFNQRIFPPNAEWKCYESLTSFKRLQKVYCLVEHDSTNFTVPGFVIGDRCVTFDSKSQSISGLVQSSVSSDVYELWRKCCTEARSCCSHMIDNYSAENFFSTCDAHWDGFNCFNETMPGETVSMSCPYHTRKDDDSTCQYFYTKRCRSDGVWSKSDFSQCHQSERTRNYVEWHVVLLSLSILFCLPPILSPILSRTFHEKHSKTLVVLIAFVTLRNILKLSSHCMIFTDSSVLIVNSLLCKAMSSCTHFFNNMTYVCLTLLTLKFLQLLKDATENWGMFICMSLGLIFNVMTTVLWTFMMKIYADKMCWMVDYSNRWINSGLIFLFIFIAIIMGILCFRRKTETYDDRTIYFLKIFILPFSTFIMHPIATTAALYWCDLEEHLRVGASLILFIQSLLLCIFYFIPSKSNLKLSAYWWSTSKISSQNSNASLAPSSRLSFNRDDHLSDDAMTHARHSLCFDNEVVNDFPEPYRNIFGERQNREESERQNRKSSRHTIRQVMLRAKNNAGLCEEISARKCSTPPLPKVIPNHILDDVQLFDFYYKNLDSIYISNDQIRTSNSQRMPTAGEKRLSYKKMGRLFSLRKDESADVSNT